MPWSIPISLTPPVPNRRLGPASFKAVVTLPEPILGLRGPFVSVPTSRPLGIALAELGFVIAGPRSEVPAPPAPWRMLKREVEQWALEAASLAELACTLRLVRRPQGTANPEIVLANLEALSDLPRRVREALAFGLVDLGLRWERGNALLEDWERGVRYVIHERGGWLGPTRPTPLPLLLDGFYLLETLLGLRRERVDFEGLCTMWEAYAARCCGDVPIAFALTYWAEATYRLTELGETDSATEALHKVTSASDALMNLLPGVDADLQGGMWWHHQARLAYYAGEFPRALALFATEWTLRSRLDATRDARLVRNLAGLLTDMGQLTLAEGLTIDALNRQEGSQEQERYKTWGRLGEIRLRQGRYVDAKAAFLQSLEAFASDCKTLGNGQTAIFLGHTALQAGDLQEASKWYDDAEECDRAAGITWNPYLWMGRAALWLQGGDRARLSDLAEIYGDELSNPNKASALPLAVLATTLHLADLMPPACTLDSFLENLMDANYLVEAIYPLTLIYPTPKTATTWVDRLHRGLGAWAEALASFTATTGLAVSESLDDLTPGTLGARLTEARTLDDWAPLLTVRHQLFPFSLLNRVAAI